MGWYENTKMCSFARKCWDIIFVHYTKILYQKYIIAAFYLRMSHYSYIYTAYNIVNRRIYKRSSDHSWLTLDQRGWSKIWWKKLNIGREFLRLSSCKIHINFHLICCLHGKWVVMEYRLSNIIADQIFLILRSLLQYWLCLNLSAPSLEISPVLLISHMCHLWISTS